MNTGAQGPLHLTGQYQDNAVDSSEPAATRIINKTIIHVHMHERLEWRDESLVVNVTSHHELVWAIVNISHTDTSK